MADWQIGKVKITRIIEGIDTFDPVPAHLTCQGWSTFSRRGQQPRRQ